MKQTSKQKKSFIQSDVHFLPVSHHVQHCPSPSSSSISSVLVPDITSIALKCT